jgi:hypothetical protein
MPRLNERKTPTVPTFLNLPQSCRNDLESAIDHKDIKTLTDAVVEAAKLLAAKVKRTKPKPSAKPSPDPP